MKVILLQDVKALGKKGEIVNVSDGYARNAILPKKIGVEATTKNLNDLKLQNQHADKVAAENLEHAKELAGRLSGLNCHINLIPLNEVKERNCYRSTKEDIEKFKTILEKYRKTVTIRREMGSDIEAACGQLRKKFLTKNGRN